MIFNDAQKEWLVIRILNATGEIVVRTRVMEQIFLAQMLFSISQLTSCRWLPFLLTVWPAPFEGIFAIFNCVCAHVSEDVIDTIIWLFISTD